jgi:hypothetical protein
MESITFPSAVLLSFSRKPKGGVAHFSSSLTKDVLNKMQWADIPDCMKGAKLDGDFTARTLVLTPQQDELKKHTLELDIDTVGKFETVRLELESSKGKGSRAELRFEVGFSAKDTAALLESFMCTIGEAKGKCTVSYMKQQKLGENGDAA